jgi:4-hydroxybenzoate polyprenyltransferase
MPKANPFDYLFILRPLILIPCWDFLLIGGFLARQRGGFSQEIILGLIIYTALMGGVYILNQIMDIETDRINKKLFLLSAGYVPVWAAYLEMVLLWAAALILSLRFGPVFFVFIALSLVMGIVYSLRPIKLKGRPILDTLANGVGYGVINFAVGWLLCRDFTWIMFLRFLPYFLGISAVFINTTIVDLEGDERSGELTTAVLLGPGLAYLVSSLLMTGAAIAAALLKDLVCLTPVLGSLPFFIYCAIHYKTKNRVDRRSTIISFRLPGMIFTLVTIVLYPPYLPFLIIILLGMRIYYKKRFGLSYPTLASG